MKPPSLEKLQGMCDRFNAAHPLGSKVWYHPIIGESSAICHDTSGQAYVLSGHTAVVHLQGKAGCVALEAITDAYDVRRQAW